MDGYRGFESYNKFKIGIRDLIQIYDFTYHLYKEENKRLESQLPEEKYKGGITVRTSVGSVEHDLISLYQRSDKVYPYKLRQLILISLITTLEVYLTDVVKEAFDRDMKLFLEDTPVQFQKNFVLNAPSIDRLRSSLVMKDIRTLTSGGLFVSKKYFKQKFKIDFSNLGANYGDVEETHIRRHIHVHRNGVCDLDYERKYPKMGYKAGDYIKIEHEYLIHALETIKEFGTNINKKMIELFPHINRKIEYYHGDARYSDDHKKIILEFDILGSTYDFKSYFKGLKSGKLKFNDYIVQLTSKDGKCTLVISGDARDIYKFFGLLKTNNRLCLTNTFELKI